jgi:hypothetical protein
MVPLRVLLSISLRKVYSCLRDRIWNQLKFNTQNCDTIGRLHPDMESAQNSMHKIMTWRKFVFPDLETAQNSIAALWRDGKFACPDLESAQIKYKTNCEVIENLCSQICTQHIVINLDSLLCAILCTVMATTGQVECFCKCRNELSGSIKWRGTMEWLRNWWSIE